MGICTLKKPCNLFEPHLKLGFIKKFLIKKRRVVQPSEITLPCKSLGDRGGSSSPRWKVWCLFCVWIQRDLFPFLHLSLFASLLFLLGAPNLSRISPNSPESSPAFESLSKPEIVSVLERSRCSDGPQIPSSLRLSSIFTHLLALIVRE